MLDRLARWVTDYAWIWIVGWFIVAGLIWIPAPRIPTLLEDDATSVVPADRPSEVALTLLRSEFPDRAAASRAAVVYFRESGLTPSDHEARDAVATTLESLSTELGWRVRSTQNMPFLRPVLESANGKAAVTVVDLPGPMLSHSTVKRVREIRRIVESIASPPGLQIEIAGNAAMGELFAAAARRDIDLTTAWAVGAVLVILIVVYRSPLATVIPLLTIAAALLMSLGLVGFAATMGLPINGLVEMFLIVMIVGCGVDYCLFLFSRFREEFSTIAAAGAAGDSFAVASAIRVAMTHSGGAILASAATIAAGLSTLLLAQNRDLYTTGPTIAFAVVMATAAVMTLAPSLLFVFRRRWIQGPLSVRDGGEGGGPWRIAARWVTMSPGWVAAIVLLALIPPAAAAWKAEPLHDAFEEFPADSSFARGAVLYREQFFQTKSVSEITLIVSFPQSIRGTGATARIQLTLDRFHAALKEKYVMLYQRDGRDPLGTIRPDRNSSGVGDLVGKLVAEFYVGKSGATTVIDIGLQLAPRSREALDAVDTIRQTAWDVFAAAGWDPVRVDVAGETALYADMRDIRRRDFHAVAAAAVAVIFVILILLLRSPAESAILLVATILTYLATYGLTAWMMQSAYGLKGLNVKVDFLLFIIILSLGQDYNIFVVARLHEELRRRPLREAVDAAIQKTGRVVSSCGIIMAATFASMFAGSLMVMKEFAVALSLGVLIDTFVVRPLLVPSLILLWRQRWVRSEESPAAKAIQRSSPNA